MAESGPGSGTAYFVWYSYTLYLEGVDLLHLRSVTGEDNVEVFVSVDRIRVKLVMKGKK